MTSHARALVPFVAAVLLAGGFAWLPWLTVRSPVAADRLAAAAVAAMPADLGEWEVRSTPERPRQHGNATAAPIHYRHQESGHGATAWFVFGGPRALALHRPQLLVDAALRIESGPRDETLEGQNAARCQSAAMIEESGEAARRWRTVWCWLDDGGWSAARPPTAMPVWCKLYLFVEEPIDDSAEALPEVVGPLLAAARTAAEKALEAAAKYRPLPAKD